MAPDRVWLFRFGHIRRWDQCAVYISTQRRANILQVRRDS